MMTHDEDSIRVDDVEEDEAQETSSSLKKKWMTSFVLLLVILVYLFAGALIFRALERPGAVQASEDFDAALRRLASENDCVDEEDVAELMYIVTRALGEGVYDGGYPYASLMTLGTFNETAIESMWSVKNNFVFVTSVVTTVGFGYTAPRTVVGQLVCVFYAVIGIPFVGTIIFTIGEILKALRQLKFTKKPNVCVVRWPRFWRDGVVVFNLLLTYLLLMVPASLIQCFTQHWSFLVSYYFSVVAMTTIGFGDLEEGPSKVDAHQQYMLAFVQFTYLLICIGLLSTMLDTFTKAQQRGAQKISSRIYQYKTNLTRYHRRRRRAIRVQETGGNETITR